MLRWIIERFFRAPCEHIEEDAAVYALHQEIEAERLALETSAVGWSELTLGPVRRIDLDYPGAVPR